MSDQAKIVAILTAREGRAADLEALLRGMALQCRAEPRNLRWDIWVDPVQPGRLVLDELYRDAAAAAAHRETPHFRNYRLKVEQLAERVAVQVSPLDIASSAPGEEPT